MKSASLLLGKHNPRQAVKMLLRKEVGMTGPDAQETNGRKHGSKKGRIDPLEIPHQSPWEEVSDAEHLENLQNSGAHYFF